MQIEAVGLHHLYPGRDEPINEAFLTITAGVYLC